MDLVEPVEHSASSQNKELKRDGQPTRSRIKSSFIKSHNLDAFLRDVRPRLKRGRSRRRSVPEFEHEDASGFEMSVYATKRTQRIALRQQISEGPEHAHGHVERSAESEGAHVGADEPRPCAYSRSFLPRQGKHFAGPVDSGDAIPTARQRDIVVASAASKVEDRLRVEMEPPEHALQKIDIAFVVDEPMINQVVVPCELTIRRMGWLGHVGRVSSTGDDAMASARRGPRDPIDTGRGPADRGPSSPHPPPLPWPPRRCASATQPCPPIVPSPGGSPCPRAAPIRSSSGRSLPDLAGPRLDRVCPRHPYALRTAPVSWRPRGRAPGSSASLPAGEGRGTHGWKFPRR